MDFAVYPNTRISRLPRFLRRPALLARNLIEAGLGRRRYPYRADDLATAHMAPFRHDEEFTRAYERVASFWRDGRIDIRWRMWLLTRLARERAGFPDGSPANLAEFGVYRGGCSYMVLSTAGLPPDQRLFLFDTFTGVPADRLTSGESQQGLAGDFGDATAGEVRDLLRPWEGQVELREGDVFDTLEQTETGPLCLVHMDLNASAPTVLALDYSYPKLVPGGVIVFDDYGQSRYEDQRLAVDRFFADRPEKVMDLPTGQGLLIKR